MIYFLGYWSLGNGKFWRRNRTSWSIERVIAIRLACCVALECSTNEEVMGYCPPEKQHMCMAWN